MSCDNCGHVGDRVRMITVNPRWILPAKIHTLNKFCCFSCLYEYIQGGKKVMDEKKPEAKPKVKEPEAKPEVKKIEKKTCGRCGSPMKQNLEKNVWECTNPNCGYDEAI